MTPSRPAGASTQLLLETRPLSLWKPDRQEGDTIANCPFLTIRVCKADVSWKCPLTPTALCPRTHCRCPRTQRVGWKHHGIESHLPINCPNPLTHSRGVPLARRWRGVKAGGTWRWHLVSALSSCFSPSVCGERGEWDDTRVTQLHHTRLQRRVVRELGFAPCSTGGISPGPRHRAGTLEGMPTVPGRAVRTFCEGFPRRALSVRGQ